MLQKLLSFVDKVKRDELKGNKEEKEISNIEEFKKKNYILPKDIRINVKSSFVNILVDHELNDNFKSLSISKNFRMQLDNMQIQLKVKRNLEVC